MHLQSVPPTPTTPAPPSNPSSDLSASISSVPARWGEFAFVEDDPGIAALERETVAKPRPMTVEPPKPFQPMCSLGSVVSVKQERKVSGLFGPTKTEDEAAAVPSTTEASIFPTPTRFNVDADPRIIHSLHLTQYARKMNAHIAELADEKSTDTIGGKRKSTPTASSNSSKSPPLLPPLPVALEAKGTLKLEPAPFPFRPPPAEETLSAFASGRWSSLVPAISAHSSSTSLSSTAIHQPPSVAPSTCRQLLKKSVITLTAHAGYDNANESAIEVLTDILHSYMTQLTTNLSEIRDAEMTSGSFEFLDILEKVFTDMGVGSAKSLVRFYEKDVVARHRALQRQCDSLQTRYLNITTGGVEASASTESTISAEGHSQDESGESDAWYLLDGGGGGDASSATNNCGFEVPYVSGLVQPDSEGLSQKQSIPHVASYAIAPAVVGTTDSTDYDADDDVITEPSSVKSGFENDNGGLIVGDVVGSAGVVSGSGDIEDSNFDLVASTLIRIESPNSGGKSAKKKKKK